MAFSADSLQLASGSEAGSNVVYSVASGVIVAACPAYNTLVEASAVTSVAFSSGGLMASGSEDNTIRVYNSSWNLLWLSTNSTVLAVTNTYASPSSALVTVISNVTAVACSPDGVWLAAASLDQTVRIWSATNGTLHLTVTGHTRTSDERIRERPIPGRPAYA